MVCMGFMLSKLEMVGPGCLVHYKPMLFAIFDSEGRSTTVCLPLSCYRVVIEAQWESRLDNQVETACRPTSTASAAPFHAQVVTTPHASSG
jgi:hypothetical protein